MLTMRLAARSGSACTQPAVLSAVLSAVQSAVQSANCQHALYAGN